MSKLLKMEKNLIKFFYKYLILPKKKLFNYQYLQTYP